MFRGTSKCFRQRCRHEEGRPRRDGRSLPGAVAARRRDDPHGHDRSQPVGMAVFLLVWIMLNCLWLDLARRPTVAALISLEILIALMLLSRFKFDKLWMTIDFVDVMIVDRDTTAFLLEIFPGLALVDPAGGCGDGRRDRHRLAAGPISCKSPDQPRWILDIGRGARCRVAVLADRPQRGFRGPKLCLKICADGRRGRSRTVLSRISRSG